MVVSGSVKPFPYFVIDGYLSPDRVKSINDEWPADWLKEDGSFNRKWSTTNLPPSAKDVVDAVDLRMVEGLTGIRGLFPDPKMFGGGLHCIPSGGFLNMHVDFNRHPMGWTRRVNMLVYLNETWQDEWGGHLCLGLENQQKIAPIGGRCVIFETTDKSWHGHPEALTCPVDVQRRSLAMYFYTADPPKGEAHSTIYKKVKR